MKNQKGVARRGADTVDRWDELFEDGCFTGRRQCEVLAYDTLPSSVSIRVHPWLTFLLGFLIRRGFLDRGYHCLDAIWVTGVRQDLSQRRQQRLGVRAERQDDLFPDREPRWRNTSKTKARGGTTRSSRLAR